MAALTLHSIMSMKKSLVAVIVTIVTYFSDGRISVMLFFD